MTYSHRIFQANNYEYPDEPKDVTISRQRDQIQDQNATIARLRTEVAQLQRAIHELEREHIPAPACEHGLPRDCCKVCASERRRGFISDWNNNVRAGGEYYE